MCLPLKGKLLLTYLNIAHLGNIPGNTLELLFSLFDPAFKLTVGGGVDLVEVKVAFIVVKTPTCFWIEFPDFFVRSDD